MKVVELDVTFAWIKASLIDTEYTQGCNQVGGHYKFLALLLPEEFDGGAGGGGL